MRKDEELLIALRKIIRAIGLRSKQLSKEVGITGPQLLVLLAIEKQAGSMVREIADTVNLSAATITSILDRLESRGFVQRIRSTEDKRRVGVNLTDLGKQTLAKAPLPLQEEFTSQFGHLELWEQSQMVATMQRVANMMDAEHIDASPVLEVGSLAEQSNHD